MEKTAEQWVVEGDKLDDNGKREEAMKCFDKAIELDPCYAKAWFLKGYLLENMGLGLQTAGDHYQKAIDLGYTTKLAYRNLAGVRMGSGQVKEALTSYLKALEIDPNELRDLPDIGMLYEELENEEEAMKYYNLCLSRDPKSIRGNAFKGYLHFKKGETEQAINHFKLALERNPIYEKICYNIGQAYMKLGKKEEAMEYWNRAPKMNPQHADAFCSRGQCYLMIGKKDLAFEDFKKAQHLLENDKKTLLSPNFITYIKTTLKAILETENLSDQVEKQIEKLAKNEVGQKFVTALKKIQENKSLIQMKALDEINKTEKDRSNVYIEELNKVKQQLEMQMIEMSQIKVQVSTLDNRVTSVERNLFQLKEEVDNKFDDFAKKLQKELDMQDMKPESQEKVKGYFKAFIGTFSSAYVTAQVINSGQVSIDNGNTAGTLLSTLASFAPFVGSSLSSAITTISEFLQEKEIKTGARRMQNLSTDGSALSQLIGKVAFQIVMDPTKQNEILRVTNEESRKVADSLFKKLCQLCKNIEDQLDTYLYGTLYQSPVERIGHADANLLIEKWLNQKVTPFDIEQQFMDAILHPKYDENVTATTPGANSKHVVVKAQTFCCNMF